MDGHSSFSDLPRAVQVQLAGIGPVLFGAVVGFVLGHSGVAYWILTVLSAVGGFAGGIDHPETRAAAARGLIMGGLFGAGVVGAHAFSGDAALATVPSPLLLLVPIAAVAGAGLAMAGSRFRTRLTASPH